MIYTGIIGKYAKREIKEAICCKYDNLASIIKGEREKDSPVKLLLG